VQRASGKSGRSTSHYWQSSAAPRWRGDRLFAKLAHRRR
jgi:hypothetical protein